MFSDDKVTSINFPSTWKSRKVTGCAGTQTSALLTNDVSCQSYQTTEHEIQTDVSEINTNTHVDDRNVVKFLQNVEEIMHKNLVENVNSRAFGGLEAMIGMQSESATSILTLNHMPLENTLSVMDLSWNSSGSVIGVAFGKADHDDWCSHKGAFCTWNIDRGRVNANKADQCLDVGSCLMSVAFHPYIPSLCAGGGFDGQVTIWDLSKTEDMEVCITRQIEDGHHEPVSKLAWVVKDNRSSTHYLISLGLDGKVLQWRVKLSRYEKPKMELSKCFVLTGTSIPRSHPSVPANRNIDIGGTSLNFSTEDPNMFVVGTESGLVLKCSLLSTELPLDRGVNVQFRSPITLVYNSHKGPVYNVSLSPFHRNLFLTGSTDSTIRIYNTLQFKPNQIIEPGMGYIFDVEWSPSRPLVFAAVTGNGQLLFFNLRHSRMKPVLEVQVNSQKSPVYCVKFNDNNHEMVATGDSKGAIQIWRLSNSLFTQENNEIRLLDRLAGSSYE